MTHCLRKSLCDSPLSLFQNVHQIPIFFANHGDNENDQDNENHPDNENGGNYRANKYMLKVNNIKKRFCVFMVIFVLMSISCTLLYCF